MLTTVTEIRRIFLSPLVGVVVFALAILSYAIGDRFTAGEFAPWLLFPGLVALFFILSPQVWVRAGFYAAAGLIAAQVVMALLGFERHGMMSHAGHHSTTVISHILFEVGVDIALAIGFVLMLKRIAPHTYEGNIIATYDVEQVLNWRLAAVLLALPFYVFAVRFIETSLAVAAFGMSFDVWPVLGADLVGYFIFLPAILGIVLALTGAPRLEPDYGPLNVLVVCYIALVGVLTELGVLFGSQVSSPVIIAPFAITAILVTLFPTMHLAGRLLFVNFAGFIIASQNAGLQVIDSSVVIISVSMCVVLVMLLRVIAQVKMNRANARTEVYLRAGTGAFAIMSEEQEFLYVSEQFLKMTGYESLEALPDIRQMIVDLSPEENAKLHVNVREVATGVLMLPQRVDTLRTKSGREIKIERSIRWFEIPGEEKRRLSVSYEDVTDKVRLEAERADQEEVLKAFVYEGPQYCFVEDEDFKIRLISEGAAELIAGKSSVELIGKDPLEYFGLDDQKRIMAARSERDERLERGETVVSDTPLTFKRGEETVKVRVQVKLLHLPSGAVMRGVIFDDITEVEAARQQAEEYLKAGTGAFQIQNERYETLYVSDKVFDLVSPEDIEDINSGDTAILAKFWPDFDDAYWMRHRKEIDALATGELWESR